MQSMPPGSMLSVNGNEREVMDFCQKYRVSVAAINSPANYVLSGETENILGAEKELVANGYQAKVLRTSHAFHSEMMESMLQEFQHYLSTFKFNAPAIPFISNLSGEMITPGEAMSPQYWVSHLRQAVNFSKGIDNLLLNCPGGIFVELGPGNTLAALTRRSKVFSNAHHVAGLIKHPQDRENGYTYFLKSLAALWVGGMHIDFLKMYKNKSGRRVHLPGYAFDDHIFNATLEFNSVRDFLSKESTNAGAKPGSIFYMPAWEQVVGHYDRPVEGKSNWLIFLNDNLDIDEISGKLAGYAAHIVFIKRGAGFNKNAENLYVINPDVKEDYFTVINSLHKNNQLPDYVIHTWTTVNDLQMLSVDRIEKYNSLGFYSVIYLAQGFGALGLDHRTDIDIITNNSLPVLGDECQYPEKAILLGASRIVPVEYSTISCRYIDINAPVLDSGMLLQCIEKLSSLPGNSCYAVRGNHLWAESYKNIALPEPMHSKSLIKTKGVYLLTGGLGGMALFIARYLADQYQAIVILVGRNTPEQLYDSDTPQNRIKLGILSDIKKSQGTVSFYQADICDKKRMIELVRDCEARYGKINGVLHTAAVADEFGAIQKRKKTDFEDSMRVKVKGTLILHDIFKDKSLDFVVLFSSTGILSPGSKYGEVGYVAANGFLDAMASQNFGAGTTVKTISWCDWSQVGLSVKSIDEFFAHDAELKKTALSAFEKEALTPEQGVHAFAQVMSNKIARTIISTKPVEKMGEKKGVNGWKIKQDLFLKQKKNRAPFEKPVRAAKYIAPVDDIQRKILDIWQDYFGYQGISVHDNIFELGATSLDVSQINESLKSKLKIQIPLVTQFEYPTIDKLSQFIKGSTSVGEEKIVEVKVENVKSKMDKMRTKAKG
jgi:polyketide synthase PksJ